MKIVNLNTSENVKTILFPDNQPHIKLENIYADDAVEVICSIDSSIKLLQLLEVSNALDNIQAMKKYLYISYLMGARYDRHMVEGDSFDLQVIAQMINSCDFHNVKILDAHSEVSTDYIRNSTNYIPNLLLYYNFENPLFICPDKGAKNRVPENADVIYCEKTRDLSTGYITLKVNNQELCNDRNCIIVDDICDGGRTFIEIAKQIAPKTLTLAVTHGIFSKGLTELNLYFDKIITTNSLPQNSKVISHKKIEIINIY